MHYMGWVVQRLGKQACIAVDTGMRRKKCKQEQQQIFSFLKWRLYSLLSGTKSKQIHTTTTTTTTTAPVAVAAAAAAAAAAGGSSGGGGGSHQLWSSVKFL